MLRVREVTGPASLSPGQRVTYRVTRFSEENPAPAEAAKVSWLIKTPAGAALTHVAHAGPELTLTVPASWAGERLLVMPYMSSPSAAIAVRSEVGAPAAEAAPRPAGAVRAVSVVREGSRYYASVDGEPRFFLGADVRYGERRGLMNSSNPPGPRYRPEDYEPAHGDWAWYLLPTILCESRGYYTCLNTYDRAAFTFGHIQLAAHTPDDNFVPFFRELLGKPSAAEYFPDLALVGGRIHLRTGGGTQPLETAASTSALMSYFNPTPGQVDGVEAERAARLVDWSLRDPDVRAAQVAFAVREQKRKLAGHAKKLPLEGLSDKLCMAVLDILHQGRGGYQSIRQALSANDPFDALLAIGGSTYRERVSTLRQGIRELEAGGRMGRKVYSAEARDFVEPTGV